LPLKLIEKKFNFFIFIWVQGCGKGTQASKIQRDFGPVPISTGHLLRMAAEHDPSIKKTVEKGGTYPNPAPFVH